MCLRKLPFLARKALIRAPHSASDSTQISRSNEAGFSLVEVMISTLILSIGILGATTLFIGSARASVATMHNTQAAQLASAEIEQLRSQTYSDIWISAKAQNYQSSYAGRPTVSEPTSKSDSQTSRSVAPTAQKEIAGQVYHVTRHVTWESLETKSEASERGETGYKVLNVIVEWSDSNGEHRTEQETGLFAWGMP